MVLAGGVGERLYPLTKERAKPAVYFGGPYRIIDFTLSNCINSGLRKIFIALQYKSLSLTPPPAHRLERRRRRARRVHRDPAARRSASASTGIRARPTPSTRTSTPSSARAPRHLIVLSGDHVYKMDYAKMLRFHRERGAGATLAVIEVPSRKRTASASLQVDEDDRLTGFLEKPRDLPPGAAGARLDGHLHLRHATSWCPRSRRTRRDSTSHDFGKDIIPSLIRQVPVYAYRFYDENKKAAKYWRDIGTLDAYYDANMDLCHVNPEFNLYDPEWPLRTHQVQAPPAKFVFADEGRRCGQALDSIISAGCIISGSRDPRQRALPQRPRAQLLRHRPEHPDAGRPGRPARAHPPRDHRPRRLHPARRAASATTRKRIAAATRSPTAASSSSRRTTSRSSAPISDEALRHEAEFDRGGQLATEAGVEAS